MMVLTSVYLSVSSSLPSTASIKPVEVWLLGNLAYPFFIIITSILHQVISLSGIMSHVIQTKLFRMLWMQWTQQEELVRKFILIQEQTNLLNILLYHGQKS